MATYYNSKVSEFEGVFEYKFSSTSAWTSTTANMSQVWAWIEPHIDEVKANRRSDSTICQVSTPRVHLEVEIDYNYLNPDVRASSTADLVFFNKFVCAPWRRFQYIPTSRYPNIDGISVFNVENEYYLNVVSAQPDYNQKKIRTWQMKFETKTKIDIEGTI